MLHTLRRSAAVIFIVILSAPGVLTQAPPPRVTSPQEQFGHEIGADYVLPNYTQLTEYWKKLDKESDRMSLVSIGKTAEGRDQWMAILTAPENFKKLDRYKEIARKLALADGLTDDQAHALAAEGKAVVWIDGGLHATEVLGAEQLMELVYQMVSRTDPETMRLLKDVIVLAVHANPDGMELVSNWYMREKDPQKRSTSGIPRAYQKYVGHDNNRDFYMSAQAESTNMNRVMYTEWFPQIMYNHHQTGPTGAVLFAPPFRDPFNYNFDPLIPVGIDMVGAAMHTRFIAEGKPGATMRRGANYSTWFNGGLRTTSYFHNMIGLLTETIGNPTPIDIAFVPQRQLPSGDMPFPVAPQKWHFRQSIDYSVTANRAVLDLASKYREQFLFNIYRMGKNSIERGNRDTWTMTPKRLAMVQSAIAKDRDAREGRAPGADTFNPAAVVGGFTTPADRKYYDEILRDSKLRDPRGYIITADQPDFLTATKFVNALLKNGVTVHRATAAFEVGGKQYPAGSYVVKTAQAFRPHVMDMFEPQDHPNDIPYPGGPPIPPYDAAGYTLAYQMGITFDRVLEGFDGPFERLVGLQRPPAGQVTSSATVGYLLAHEPNDAFVAINRLLKANEEVYWLKEPTKVGARTSSGALFIPSKTSTLPILQKAAADLGLSFEAASSRPGGEMIKLRPVRIGLADQYGGNMPSGWLRWIFERSEFPFEVVYPQGLDTGNLRSRFDVLVFADGSIPERDGARSEFAETAGSSVENVPDEFKPWTGAITIGKTVPQLRKFVDEGGVLIAIGSSTAIAKHFGLPVASALVERTANGDRALTSEKFYVPGSVLRAAVDTTQPIAQGLPDAVNVFFDHSPVFRLDPSAMAKGIRPVAWYDSPTPLRSGWAWGQHYLDGGIAAVDAPVGKGRVYLFGPEITFRSQPHGTFKFLFNAIYYGAATTQGGAASMSAER